MLNSFIKFSVTAHDANGLQLAQVDGKFPISNPISVYVPHADTYVDIFVYIFRVPFSNYLIDSTILSHPPLATAEVPPAVQVPLIID